ncbi:histidine kinase [Fulvivirga sp. M361]|uniref:FIST signal transduction protein n=1 Tax=Fulvivirga sp. M361 TaxID=2594266 RepID=UPI001179AC52|nr:FIST C-terminal domain-containing protein [Fulvivirga sp. M361]TRX59472.1 histidine kinase [Fulvivirga sp. M361]
MLVEQPHIGSILAQCTASQLNFLMVGEHSDLDISSLVQQANEVGIRLAGGIFPGILHGDRHLEKGVIIKPLNVNSSFMLFQGLTQRHELPEIDETSHSAIVLLDGLTNGIPHFLESIYEKYGDNLNYIGGGCGSLSLKSQPCIFTNDGFFQDAGLLIYVPDQLKIGVQHGWKKIEGPFLVNKSEGNVIYEINWKPAFEVYKKVVDAHSNTAIEQDNFFGIAKGYPFGIFREGYENVVRDPIMTLDKRTLTCVGEVNNNTSVDILVGSPHDLIASAGKAAETAVDGVDTMSVLVVDCISRVLFLEQDFSEELEVVNSVIKQKKDSIELEGVLSLGEISSFGEGYLEFFNKTIVVSSFY